MCGIFGYVGDDNHSIKKAIIGLKNLEYRGYDSWGVATLRTDTKGGIYIKKSVGKISDANEDDFKGVIGNISLGHSRWATHGGVTEVNAHPHYNEARTLFVVHNGIIENSDKLRERLSHKKFVSGTDTEVIPHLIEDYLDKGQSLEEAFVSATLDLEGRFAFLLSSDGSNAIMAARSGSPLIVGKGEGEFYLASDIPAFLDYTNVVNYIDDGEYVIISRGEAKFYNLATGELIEKRDVIINWDKEKASKGDYAHFMLKEIMEQKETLIRAVKQDNEELHNIASIIRNSRRVLFTGSGTAGHTCMTARYFFNTIADKQTSFVTPSEFDLYKKFMGPDALLVAVSQSGETADVLEAIKSAKEMGSKILSIVNTRGSSIERAGDYRLHIKAGPEIAVASTKATTSQLAVLFLIAHAVAGSSREAEQIVINTAERLNDWLNPRYIDHIQEIAIALARCEHVYVIGRSSLYPIALEAALKIQEISYVHAEGFPGGEIKHGPIALIDIGTPVLALVGDDVHKKDILSNVAELKARGAFIVAVASENNKLFDKWIQIPKEESIAPVVSLIPIQLLAYFMSTAKLLNPDKPRNLAKSVTVK